MSLDLVDITHRYGGSEPLFRDLSLTVDRGEVVAVMGPSGSGKTTLLSIAGLLLRPIAGEVRIDGRRMVSRVAVAPTSVSWILQTTTALPYRSVVDNIALAGIACGWSRRDTLDRALEALEQVGLSGSANQKARHLSGGELQRLAVARGLVVAPDVLLADEPTANLDRRMAEGVTSAIVGNTAAMAVLIATHDERVASRADRVVRLDSRGLRDA